MARRRLNTKVFAILLGVLVVGSAAIVAARQFAGRNKGDPRALEADGDALMAKRDYEQARDRYAMAANRDPSNPGLKVKLGEALVKLTRDEPANLDLAHRVWAEAVAADPTHAPALEKLLKSLWERVEIGGGAARAEVFTEIRQRAEQLARANPAHPQAKVWRHMATVRQSLAGQAIPQEDVDASTAALAELAAANPADPEPPYYIALDRLKAARDRVSARDPGAAERAAAAAADVMTKALAGQEKNARMQYRAALVFWQLARPTARDDERTKAERATHMARANACIERAAQVVGKNDPDRTEITLTAADVRQTAGRTEEERKAAQAEARAMVQKLFEENPQDQQARIAWARWLTTTREGWPKAIELLSQEVPVPPDAVGVGVIVHKEQQAQALYELIRFRLADAAESAAEAADRRKQAAGDAARQAQIDTETAARRKQIAADVDVDLAKLRKLASPKAPRVLALEGQVLLFKNKPIEAVRVMEEAYAGMPAGAKDWDTVFRLAQTYAGATRQPGLARKLCEEMVAVGTAPPGLLLPARALLAELLLQENRAPAAREQIQAIEQQAKDFPDLVRLKNMVAMVEGSRPEQADRLLAAMPERDNRERWAKVGIARNADKQDELVRLLNLIVRADPKDVNAVRLLAVVYKQRQQDDRARQVIEGGLLAIPNESSLELMKAELNGATPQEVRELARREVAAKVTDPYDRAMRLYDLERLPGGSADAALGHLETAAGLRPDDRQAREALFQEYVARQRMDKAREQMAKLVELNADQVGGRLYKHRYAMARRDHPEAERVGLDLVTTYPQFAQSWLALGQAQEALGKWNDAIRSFTEVLVRQPSHYDATRQLVDALYNAGRTDEAEIRLRDMRTQFPNDAVVRELYLNHLANFGKPHLAIPDRKAQLAKAADGDPWPYLALAATHFKNAQRLAAENKPDDSRKEIESAFQTLSQGRDKFQDDTRFYAQVAEIHQYNGRFDQAESILKAYADRELTKQPPAKVRPDPWQALADLYNRASMPDKAADAMAQALVRSGNDPDMRLRLVAAQVQARRFADAQATLDTLRDSNDPRVVRQRIEVLIARGALKEAEVEIAKALATRDGADLRNLMASVLIDTDRAAEAAAQVEKSLALDPTNEPARYLRALALAKKRPPEYDAAINELVDLKKSAPRNMQARLLLAELYERTGRRTLAIQDLEDALQKAPGHRELRLSLVRMYRSERPPQFRPALELVAKAEADPVLNTDAAWPREAALLWMQQRNYPQAVMKMHRAVQLAPGNVTYRQELVDILLQFNDLPGALIETEKLLRDGVQAWWLYQQRGIALAKQVTRRMLDEAKTKPEVAKRVAELQSQALVEFDRAIAQADKAGDEERSATILRILGQTTGNDHALKRVAPRLANDPTNRWKLLAIALKRAQGDFAGAIADAERMLAEPANATSDPNRRGPILRALADTYQSKPNPDLAKARSRYDELLKLVPDDLASLNNIAFLLAEGIKPPELNAARTYSERAYELTRLSSDPSHLVIDTHGWVLVLSGGEHLPRGVQILKNLIDQNPLFIEGRYHLGEGLLRSQPAVPGAAEKEFAECLRLMEEEEKVGGTIDEKLRGRIQVSLSKARELAKGG